MINEPEPYCDERDYDDGGDPWNDLTSEEFSLYMTDPGGEGVEL